MFSGKYITYQELLQKLDQEQLFYKYLGYLPDLKKRYLSPFRNDRTPGCRFQWQSGVLYFIDNATFNGKLYWNIIDIICYFQNVSFKEAIYILLKEQPISINPTQVVKETKRPEIFFEYEPFEENNLFFLPNAILEKEYIYKVTDYWIKFDELIKNPIHNPKKTLCIAYYFPDSNHVKLYFPNETHYKWFSNCDVNDVFGKYKLDYYLENNDIIYITKSQKDRIILDYHNNMAAIAVQNEGSYLPEYYIDLLKHKEVYTIFDNDNTGKKTAAMYEKKYNFKPLFFKNHKDAYETFINNNHKLDELTSDIE